MIWRIPLGDHNERMGDESEHGTRGLWGSRRVENRKERKPEWNRGKGLEAGSCKQSSKGGDD